MSKTVNFGQVVTDKIKQATVSGVRLAMYLVHAINDTDFVASDFDYSQVTTKIILRRNGQETIIAQDNLRNLGCATNYFTPLFLAAKDFTTNLYQLLAKGASTKTIQATSMIVNFGSVIHLKGDDELHVELNLATGSANATNVNTTLSNGLLDWQLGMGTEYGTPRIKAYTIQASEQSPGIVFGDDVTGAWLLNFDKTSFLSAAAVVSTLKLSSDKYNIDFTYQQLLSQQNSQFPTVAEAKNRVQSYALYNNTGIPLESCKLNLQLNTSNVAASQNVVVWRQIDFAPDVFVKAINRDKGLRYAAISKAVGSANAAKLM